MKDSFSAVVGNKKLCKRLENDVLNNKLPHAFILEGPYGTGKHTIAINCAAALVCTEK